MNKNLALGMIAVGFVVIIGSVLFMNHMLKTAGVACMTDPFGYGIALLDESHQKPDVCSCQVTTTQGLRNIVVSGDADLVNKPVVDYTVPVSRTPQSTPKKVLEFNISK